MSPCPSWCGLAKMVLERRQWYTPANPRMNTKNDKLTDVRKAFASLPPIGEETVFPGHIFELNPDSHIQGLSPYKDFLLMTHSVAGKPSGLLVTLRRTGALGIIKEISLPVISQNDPHYNHPGGIQLIGDCLIIPMETEAGQDAASAVCFFDIS